MNYSIILSGGTGSRLSSSIPKQYIEVEKKPVIAYCLEKFQKHDSIDSIFIVAAQEWYLFIGKWIKLLKMKQKLIKK